MPLCITSCFVSTSAATAASLASGTPASETPTSNTPVSKTPTSDAISEILTSAAKAKPTTVEEALRASIAHAELAVVRRLKEHNAAVEQGLSADDP